MMKNNVANDPDVKEIIRRIEANNDFSTEEVIELQRNPGVIPGVIVSLQGCSAQYRGDVVSWLEDLGETTVSA